jgi:hypothetical protein
VAWRIALTAGRPPAAESVSALATWVPWDGFQITSAANCAARKATIAATYNIALKDLKCQRIDIGLPPCPLYRWILMVNADAFAVATVPNGRTDALSVALC